MENLYDAVVVGGGPAGLTAAIYLARARYRVLVIEKEQFGGQITITSEVVNYPGIERTSGTALTESMRRQGEHFGAQFLLAEVTGLDLSGDVKIIHTTRGDFRCFGVLIATGAYPRTIGFAGEAEFRGHGVAYCATCDGEFFTGKEVFVVGGGFAAAEESVFLTKYARHVTILVREPDFTCAKSVADAARAHEKITVLTNTVVEEAAGDSMLRSLRYRNTETGEITEYRPPAGETFGIFVFAGYQPATALVQGLVELDAQGYVVTDRSQQTSAEGVYAAGDVCVKNLRQVATAVGDGAAAATELEKYAARMQEKTGLHPAVPDPAKDAAEASPTEGDGAQEEDMFPPEMRAQLETVFQKMEAPLLLEMSLDDRPVSAELEQFLTTLTGLTDKLTLRQAESPKPDAPCVRILRADGEDTGIAFHGVPGGHEFTSFVLALYNAAGPGQSLPAGAEEAIRAIQRPVQMQVFVSLSCTMCPELVAAAQRIASLNPLVSAEAYDLNHFPSLRDQYEVMSVPCLIIGSGKPVFGKKNIQQLLDLLKEHA